MKERWLYLRNGVNEWMGEAVGETHLFVFLKDESFPLGVNGGQRQRKIRLAHVSMLLTQTKTHFHTHTHTKKKAFNVILAARMREVTVQSTNQSIKPCRHASWLHPPAFPLLHHHARHVLDALGSVVFVVRLPHHVLQILHVRPHQHVPQQQEVRVSRVLHWPTQRQRVTGADWLFFASMY